MQSSHIRRRVGPDGDGDAVDAVMTSVYVRGDATATLPLNEGTDGGLAASTEQMRWRRRRCRLSVLCSLGRWRRRTRSDCCTVAVAPGWAGAAARGRRWVRDTPRVWVCCAAAAAAAAAAVVLLLCALFVLWACVLLLFDPDTATGVRLGVVTPFHAAPVDTETQASGGLLHTNAAASAATTALALTLHLLHGGGWRGESDALVEVQRILYRKQLLRGDAANTVLQPDMMGEHSRGSGPHALPLSPPWRAAPSTEVEPSRVRAPVLRALRSCVSGGADDASAAASTRSMPPVWAQWMATTTSAAAAAAAVSAEAQCVRRRQSRLACADAEASEGEDTHDHRRRSGSSNSSGVQRRTTLSAAAVAHLFFSSTPALAAADVSAWRARNGTRISRAAAQLERFHRCTPPPLSSSSSTSTRTTASSSGVLLMLAGSGDRHPGMRRSVLERVTLPLLEQHFLSLHPHYPLHIFYEADGIEFADAGTARRGTAPRPAWTLSDALRHSDVYTVPHSWRPGVAAGGAAGGAPHVPPPPPVLVASADMLPAMERTHAALADWFARVAAAVPSAPYVTLENVAPLFAALPCGVSEAMVESWVRHSDVEPSHGRGYRQMSRFWARLVWRLPSLRVWMDAAEGRGEAAAYGGGGGGGDDVPPWRFRYAYYWRLDTDSWLSRPVVCDPLATMASLRCAYGYRELTLDVARVVRHLGDALLDWAGNGSSAAAVGAWGALSDPASAGLATLTAAGGLPPLPPTWPWYGVYPEHSSAALSAAERDVLRAYFFTGASTSPHTDAVRDDAAAAGHYNRIMYYNNFELGTFALKTHPLYTSVVDFLDDGDRADWGGAVRAAQHSSYTLHELPGGGAARVNPVFVLTAVALSTSAANGAHARSDAPRQCRADGVSGRAWRSGYLQYRWGDAPVHTFAVEAALQREGWAVCQFDAELGGYAHSPF
ncbi:hypothetical protein NESM_000708500 [Novymonas esmeraldas]|uniref:Uncharacterized protein n=1 Tax=Novymonas esmeraldas TaxID=1808958 RepID=A0AAW0EXQ3_9TRYP